MHMTNRGDTDLRLNLIRSTFRIEYVTRICTSPIALPVLQGEQRRYIKGEPQLKGPVRAAQPSITRTWFKP